MASTHLSRTSGSPTNALKWTYSFWVKISSLSTSDDTFLLDFNTDDNNRSNIGFNGSQQLVVYEKVSGSTSQLFTSNRLFRDPSAWMHIVVSCDRTLSTAGDRTKIYINGVQETSWSSQTNPAQNTTGIINTAVSTLIGKYSQNTYYFDGSLTHVHFVDGTAYAASTFGETDSTSGIWSPKTAPSVTYGTNGFFLKFENSGAMGTDSSGNTNTFTVSGNLTQNVDTASNNFATLNPLQNNIANLSNGNLTATTSNYQWGMSTLAVNSGKWYVEMKVTHACMIMGIQDIGKANDRLAVNGTFWTSGSQSYHLDGFSKFTHDSYGDISSDASAYPSYGSGDIVMMALDLDNNKLAYGKNGTWYNSTNPSSGTTNMVSIDAPSSNENGNYGIVFGDTCGANDGTFNINFGNGFFGTTAISSEGTNASGNGKFEYDVPTGYTALSTKGLNL